MRFSNRRKRGFTIIELLVVIAIIAILVALILPAVQMAREAARRTECKNHLKEIGVALHNYHDAHNMFPPGWISVDEDGDPDAHNGQSGAGWALMILPYMEQGALFDAFQSDVSIVDPANSILLETGLDFYKCTSDPKPDRFDILDADTGAVIASMPISNYIGVFGTDELEGCDNSPGDLPVNDSGECVSNGVFHHNSDTRIRDVRDGTSNTMYVGERKSNEQNGWYATWVGMVPGGVDSFQRVLGSADHPPNESAHFDDFSSHHKGGAQFLFGDGAVKLISDSINVDIYHAISTISEGEIWEGEGF